MITFKKWQQLHESLSGRTLGVSTPASMLVSNRSLDGQDALDEARKKMKKKMIGDVEPADEDDEDDLDDRKVADTDCGSDDESEDSSDDDADADPRVKRGGANDPQFMKKKMKKESVVGEGKLPPWLQKGKDGDDKKGDGDKKDGKGAPPWMGKKKSDDEKSSKGKEAADRFKKIKDKVKEEAAEAFDDMFFSSLTHSTGKPNTKNKDGWTEYQVDEEALLPPDDPNEEVAEPGPGEVGYAPTGRYGQPLGPQVSESKGKPKAKKK